MAFNDNAPPNPNFTRFRDKDDGDIATPPAGVVFLFWDGSTFRFKKSDASFVNIATGTVAAGGADTEVQFNSAGTFDGNPEITIHNASNQLRIGGAGTLRFAGSTSGTITLAAPAVAGTQSYTLPPDDGDNGEFLKTNGSGVLTWEAVASPITGSDTRVLFFDGADTPAGDAGFTYNKTADTATLTGSINAAGYVVGFQAKSADYTLTVTDTAISVDASGAARTITLPDAAGNTGRLFRVKKIDSSVNAVIIDGDGADTIDGAATYSLTAQYQAVDLISNGTNWLIY